MDEDRTHYCPSCGKYDHERTYAKGNLTKLEADNARLLDMLKLARYSVVVEIDAHKRLFGLNPNKRFIELKFLLYRIDEVLEKEKGASDELD